MAYLCSLCMQSIDLDSKGFLGLDAPHVACSVLQLPPYAGMLPVPGLLLNALLVQTLKHANKILVEIFATGPIRQALQSSL